MGKYSRKAGVDYTKLIIAALLAITMAAVSVTVWALFFRTPEETLVPDYAPKATEAYAQVIPNDTAEKKSSEPGGGSVSLTYSNQVSIDMGKETAALLFANPGKSNQNMVLQIVIQNQVIVQSGKILPGHQVKKLDLLEDAASKLSPGGYEGKFVVLYYHPETEEKAIVSTEIPIQIEVHG